MESCVVCARGFSEGKSDVCKHATTFWLSQYKQFFIHVVTSSYWFSVPAFFRNSIPLEWIPIAIYSAKFFNSDWVGISESGSIHSQFSFHKLAKFRLSEIPQATVFGFCFLKTQKKIEKFKLGFYSANLEKFRKSKFRFWVKISAFYLALIPHFSIQIFFRFECVRN